MFNHIIFKGITVIIFNCTDKLTNKAAFKIDKRGQNCLKNTNISCFLKTHALFFGQKSFLYKKKSF